MGDAESEQNKFYSALFFAVRNRHVPSICLKEFGAIGVVVA